MMQTILESVAGSRRLTVDDKDATLDLLETCLQEVPVYRWFLGEGASPEAYRWLAQAMFEMNIHGLHGMFDSDELIALVAVTEPDAPPVTVSEELKALNRHYMTSLHGFVDRFREFGQVCVDAAVPGAIDIPINAVHPDHRRRGLSVRLIEPVLEYARRRGVPVTGSTTHPHMSAFYSERGGSMYSEYKLTGGPTLWMHRWDPPVADTSD
ncbi:GNAT family N-acetyltransferase [Gordonia paraffinivorans]|uniref:GNAT family N-acetyltransferase n=1 Tax=Gordonia paraffinivorans TaxID=175628 RepID=UPI0021B240C7|nr:GNAT family N-acetyltransferase [Gordonia paraffinivorans]